MKHIKTFQLWESAGQTGLYSNEEMDQFIRGIADMAAWEDKPTVTIPSARDRNAGTVCHTKDELISNWDYAFKAYGDDEDVAWYVWDAKMGGVNKPIKLVDQRIDAESITSIVQKNPEALRYISIGMSSKQQDKHEDGMRQSYKDNPYNGD